MGKNCVQLVRSLCEVLGITSIYPHTQPRHELVVGTNSAQCSFLTQLFHSLRRLVSTCWSYALYTVSPIPTITTFIYEEPTTI
jgi:hypothetical protein